MREGVGVAGRFKSYNRTTLSVMVGKGKERKGDEREKNHRRTSSDVSCAAAIIVFS